MARDTTRTSRLDKALADPTPLYAVVGLGDFAVERIRDARVKLDAKALREQAQAKLSASVESVQADVKAAPEQVMDLPVRVQAAVTDAVNTTVTTYTAFANRGRQLVTRVRTQRSTRDFENQASETVSRTKAASTTAKKSAKTTASSAKRTTRTAKAAADTTKGSAKAATTSTRKSAAAAKQATQDAADKVGD